MAAPLTRHVTTHLPSDSTGRSVTVSSVPVPLSSALDGNAAFAPLFSTVSPTLPLPQPHHLSSTDLEASASRSGGKVVVPSGLNCLVTELKPNFFVKMHRTNSVDFNVLTHGSVWLITPAESSDQPAGTAEGGQEAGQEEAYPSPAHSDKKLEEDGWTGEIEGMKVCRRLVNAGEIVIQTGTLHAWLAGPEGARWVTVNAAAEPVSVGGEALPEVDFQ